VVQGDVDEEAGEESGMKHWFDFMVWICGWVVAWVGILYAALNICAWLMERVINLIGLHACFIDFMFDWIKKRPERKESKQ
jgi:hypothetical protein